MGEQILWVCPKCGWQGHEPDESIQAAFNGSGIYIAPVCPPCGLYLDFPPALGEKVEASLSEKADSHH